jgi:hypothetical protein
LFILDLGGDDTYYVGGATYDLTNPVSVIIDRAGNDKYLASESLQDNVPGKMAERKSNKIHPSFGAGVFGYGIVVDMEGNDTYRAFRHTMGRGDFGIGLLLDLAGNDTYDCYVQCQGSGEFGAGLLVDLAGEDIYTAFQQAQGFGGVLGAGLLVDAGKGNDTYIADNSQIDFPATVDKKQNTSLAQGAAIGIRADFLDGHSYSAGFGALVDGGGNNTFNAGFFAQGVSYWYGVGILSVGDGNDTYEAGKYAQGAGVHFGVGILHDTGGADSYKISQELGLGEGHDFGVGFFLDESGNDTYSGANLSFGCGSANGIGIFWDREGDDEYTSKDKTVFGCASYRVENKPTIRGHSKTIGLFFDTGGKNKFNTTIDKPKGVVKSAQWRHFEEGPEQTEKAFGLGLVIDSPSTADPE